MKKIKILLITQDPYNNISFYRGVGPMQRLSEHYDVEYDTAPSQFQFTLAKEYDIVFMSCPYTDAHVQFCKFCEENNIKMWIDYDDLITDVSVWNPEAWLEYNKYPVRGNLEFILSKAAWVTVSTSAL